MYEDYQSSYVMLPEKAKLSALHVKRMRILAVEIFKILNKLTPPVLTNLLVKRESSYNFMYTNILQVPHVKTTKFGKNYFRYAAPVLWNSLPENFRNLLWPDGTVRTVTAPLVKSKRTFPQSGMACI